MDLRQSFRLTQDCHASCNKEDSTENKRSEDYIPDTHKRRYDAAGDIPYASDYRRSRSRTFPPKVHCLRSRPCEHESDAEKHQENRNLIQQKHLPYKYSKYDTRKGGYTSCYSAV